MLRVHGDDFRPPLLRRLHHQLSGADQGFLVGQGDALALPDGGQGGLKTHHTHHGGDHRIDSRQGRRRGEGGNTAVDTGVCVRQADLQVPGRRLVGHDDLSGPEFPGLFLRQGHAVVGGDGSHRQPQLFRHVQGLPPNGAGGA